MTHVIRRLTIALAICAAFGLSIFTVVKTFLPVGSISTDAYLAVALFVLGALSSYLYAVLEQLRAKADVLVECSKIAPTIVCRSRDVFASSLQDITLDADAVSTQMFSDPPNVIGGAFERYFDNTALALKSKSSTTVFRRIATISDVRKARWILSLIDEFADIDRFSLAVIDIDHNKVPLTCIHICQKGNAWDVSFFSTLPPGGSASGYFSKDPALGQAFLNAYDQQWAKSTKLKEGNRIHYEEIVAIAKRFSLEGTMEYKRLLARTA